MPAVKRPRIFTALASTARAGVIARAPGSRVRKDGTRFLGACRARSDPRRGRQPDRLRQDHPRHHRARRSASARSIESEQRFRMLVQGVRDYAIYMLDPTARSPTGTPAPKRSRAIAPTRSSASISRASTPTRTARAASRRARSRPRFAKANMRRKPGASARTARASGRAWCSTRSTTRPATLIGFAKITRDITEQRARPAGAGGGARRPVPVAEAAGAGRAHRRHRPRFQQSDDGDPRLGGTAAARRPLRRASATAISMRSSRPPSARRR